MNSISISVPGALGVDVGVGSKGMLYGSAVNQSVGAAILSASLATSGVSFITDDGGLYVDDSTDFNDAGAGDVQPLPTTPANDDAVYIGADAKFSRVDIDVGTAGDGSWTFAWEVWTGSAWTAVTGLTDPTSGFSAGSTGVQSITFTPSASWVQNTVDSVLKYWLRGRVVAFTSIVTPAVIDQGFVILDAAALTDDTTDANDSGANDVAVTSSFPAAGDRFYIGHADKFCKVIYDIGTAATGTLTFQYKYFNGSTWANLTVNDPSVDFSDGTGEYVLSFDPPSDWSSTTVDSFTGMLIAAEVATASGATAPLLDQAWVLPLTATAITGMVMPSGMSGITLTNATVHGKTASAAGTATKVLLVNATSGVFKTLTIAAAQATTNHTFTLSVVAGDELALIQVAEQGTTEFSDVEFTLLGA